MASPPARAPDDVSQLVRALSRWDNEGGAGDDGPQVDTAISRPAPPLEREVVALRIRVIALENLAIALLAAGSDGQQQVAQRMVGQLAPDGAAQQQITTHAAAHMCDLIEHASSIRAEQRG
jgi:hypothetical protein